MNEQDRQAIEGLFSRLSEAEKQAGPRDTEADAFIRQRIGDQPGAPYMMAQTIVMQNYALEQAQQRINELEAQSAASQQAQPNGGGMLGGFFGGGRSADAGRRPGMVPVAGQRANPAGGGPQPPMQPQAGGGGFLAGAAQTAMGVAGGMMLGSALGGMFGGSSAEAAPGSPPADAAVAQPDPAPADPAPEPAAEESGGGFFDSIFGDGDDSDF
ncbi:MAG: DUF2076 domain-containing protein [Rhodomicrobiaceae bacterium]